MKIVYKIALLLFLPITVFSQETENGRLETTKPDIYEFSEKTSLLQSFSTFVQVDELDPRIKYMYQSTPFQRSINMTQIALQEDNSDEWYNYNENPETFAQRQQKQINEAVKVFSQDNDKKIQLRVEEGYQNPQFSRFNRFNSSFNRANSFYYPQRNVRLMIDLSDD
jgi:hypothetical protein